MFFKSRDAPKGPPPVFPNGSAASRNHQGKVAETAAWQVGARSKSLTACCRVRGFNLNLNKRRFVIDQPCIPSKSLWVRWSRTGGYFPEYPPRLSASNRNGLEESNCPKGNGGNATGIANQPPTGEIGIEKQE